MGFIMWDVELKFVLFVGDFGYLADALESNKKTKLTESCLEIFLILKPRLLRGEKIKNKELYETNNTAFFYRFGIGNYVFSS